MEPVRDTPVYAILRPAENPEVTLTPRVPEGHSQSQAASLEPSSWVRCPGSCMCHPDSRSGPRHVSRVPGVSVLTAQGGTPPEEQPKGPSSAQAAVVVGGNPPLGPASSIAQIRAQRQRARHLPARGPACTLPGLTATQGGLHTAPGVTSLSLLQRAGSCPSWPVSPLRQLLAHVPVPSHCTVWPSCGGPSLSVLFPQQQHCCGSPGAQRGPCSPEEAAPSPVISAQCWLAPAVLPGPPWARGGARPCHEGSEPVTEHGGDTSPGHFCPVWDASDSHSVSRAPCWAGHGVTSSPSALRGGLHPPRPGPVPSLLTCPRSQVSGQQHSLKALPLPPPPCISHQCPP